jgi:hypothetical protein
VGGWVEKYQDQTKEGITKAAHHSIPAFIEKLGRTVEKTLLRPNTKKGITKAAHHSIPAFIGRNWVGLLKNTLKTKHKERNHKRAASLNPCFHR